MHEPFHHTRNCDMGVVVLGVEFLASEFGITGDPPAVVVRTGVARGSEPSKEVLVLKRTMFFVGSSGTTASIFFLFLTCKTPNDWELLKILKSVWDAYYKRYIPTIF